MADEITWRFLVVDDKQADETEEFIKENKVLSKPDRVVVEKCQKFTEALEILGRLRIDLVILDLKDDSNELEDDEKLLAGEIVFNQICSSRFIPVIFYTAYPEKVRGLENPYIRVVTRGEERKLREVIHEVFKTGLPNLSKHLEEEQRKYLWEGLKFWHLPTSPFENTEVSYLLARRLANTLERNSIRKFLHGIGLKEDDPTIHPMEMYIFPPINTKPLGGDIYKGKFHDIDGYWIVLTPSCDFEQGNVNNVLLSECKELVKQPEYDNVIKYWEEIKKAEEDKTGQTPKSEPEKILRQLIRDNHQGQRERYKFLPGTFFMPDLLIDFQSVIQIPIEQLSTLNRITTLDNPFAEACISKFSRYYGRIGTPDLNNDIVCGRLHFNWLKIHEKETNP